MDRDEFLQLADSWYLSMAAERLSPRTIKGYRDGLAAFDRWARAGGKDLVLDKPTVRSFTADLASSGAEAATVRARNLAVRRFSRWLAAEDEIPADELVGLAAPKLDQKVVEALSDEQLAALIKACEGTAFRDRRDEAIVRLAAESLLRAGDLIQMTVEDTDVRTGVAVIRKSKGGKGRLVSFGPQTARALDRYLRMRRRHRLAETPAFWLGDRGKGLGYHGLYDTLRYRAGLAGIADFHPHRLRHTGATRWLDAGGSEGGLMTVAGWSTRSMIERYTRATAARRAVVEARELGLGDI